MHRDTTGYLFGVTIFSAHISSNGSHFSPAGFLDHTRSVKLGMGCFYMLCSLLNVLGHHLWVQFSKSTLFWKCCSCSCSCSRYWVQHLVGCYLRLCTRWIGLIGWLGEMRYQPVQCAMDTVHYTLYTQYTFHWTHPRFQPALCWLKIVHYKLYIVYSALFTVITVDISQ